MQTALVEFQGSSAYIPESTKPALLAAIQQLLCVTAYVGPSRASDPVVLCFAWDGETQPGLTTSGTDADLALSAMRSGIEDTAGFWADFDAHIPCWLMSGDAPEFRPIGSLTVRECVEGDNAA